MNVDEELIRNVAKTARLKLTDEEVKKFVPEMKDIIEAFSKLDKIDTKNVKLSLQPIEIRNVLREDLPEKCYTNEMALSQTKHKKDGYFKGPSAL